MSENIIIALISFLSAILGAAISGFLSIIAANIKNKNEGKSGNKNSISCAVVGLIASAGGIGGLVLGAFFGLFLFQKAMGTLPTESPTQLAIQSTQMPLNSPTLTLGLEPVFEGSVKGVSITNEALKLSSNQIIIGTADKYQDVKEQASPPFAVFVIFGAIDENISLSWGGWDQWRNATSSLIESELQKKIQQTKDNHSKDWVTRGINISMSRNSPELHN